VSSKIGKIVRKLAKDAPIPGEYSPLVYRSTPSYVVPKCFEFPFMVRRHTSRNALPRFFVL
jgi:hypothetical protein